MSAGKNIPCSAGWFSTLAVSSALGLAVFLSACKSENPEPPQHLEATITPAESERTRALLRNWLECDECEEDQLQHVLENGRLLYPMLLLAVEKGAAPTSRELLRISLRAEYMQLEEFGESHPESRLALSESEYVQLYLSRLDERYIVRSAEALSRIGGPEAQSAIRAALDHAESPSLQANLREALAVMSQ